MRYANFILVAAFATFSLSAQEVTAGIYGTVRDSTSAVIPNAAIALHNVATGRDYQATSDQSGNLYADADSGRQLRGVRPSRPVSRREPSRG